jgi:hypothetical protein
VTLEKGTKRPDLTMAAVIDLAETSSVLEDIGGRLTHRQKFDTRHSTIRHTATHSHRQNLKSTWHPTLLVASYKEFDF